jgi:hypothetical protein
VKLTTRDFLRELAAERDRLRRDIEARRLALDPSPAARAERRRRVLVEQDYWWWATTYFPHHVWGEPSQFQAHFSARVPALLRAKDGCVEWWIAPRGEAKSTLGPKLLPIWCAIQALLQRPDIRAEVGIEQAPPPIDYVILAGAELRLPTKTLDVVKVELESNPTLALDWPEAVGRGRLWRVGEIVTASGVKIEPYGAEMAIRGTFHGSARPKLILPDDLITDAEAKSAAERDGRWTWITRALEYLGPPDGSLKSLGVGTILHHDDPISRAKRTPGHLVHHFRALVSEPERQDLWGRAEEMMRNEDREAMQAAAAKGRTVAVRELPSRRYYDRHRKQMDRGAVVSWPGVRDLYSLIRMRVRARRAFDTEMQGEASALDRVFAGWRYWAAEPPPEAVWYGAVDPSMGRRDPSGILWGAWAPTAGVLYVRHADVQRRAPSKLRADLVRYQRQQPAAAVAFENNNAYEDMRRTTIQYGIEHRVPLPLIGVTAVDSPEVRIESLEPYLSDPAEPRILLHASCAALVSELETWPEPAPGHHYEALTCLYMLWTLCVTRSQQWTLHRTPNPALEGLHSPGAF